MHIPVSKYKTNKVVSAERERILVLFYNAGWLVWSQDGIIAHSAHKRVGEPHKKLYTFIFVQAHCISISKPVF